VPSATASPAPPTPATPKPPLPVRDFSQLFLALERSTGTRAKKQLLKDYFRDRPDADAAWALYFLSGRRPKRLLPPSLLRPWVAEEADLPLWLLEEAYHHVGDLAETTALLLPSVSGTDVTTEPGPLSHFVPTRLLSLEGLPAEEQRESLRSTWALLRPEERLVFHKLLTGGFRVGVQQKTVQNALAELYRLNPAIVAHRMMGNWQPTPDFFAALRDPAAPDGESEPSRPYPFCLAHPLESAPPEVLDDFSLWQVEPKWDGIRAQLIRRSGLAFLWSRGEENVGPAFPEILEASALLPDGTVLDGEILVWQEGRTTPEPFASLQTRLGRKKVGKQLRNQRPVRFLAYDLLETNGQDLRGVGTETRRVRLESLWQSLPENPTLQLSPLRPASTREQARHWVDTARERREEGLLLKHRDAPYHSGRPRGAWWKWKVDPLRIDAVLLYAQAGHGRRSGLFTDYTFAVRHGDQLLPVAKAYSGLDDAEIRELDRWIKGHTLETFGPVRSVPPEKVFEIAFDSLRPSSRHKAGLALRFPRIARWRHDKTPEEINTLTDLQSLLPE